MYKEMPRMFLRLDQEEWKKGYKAGNSSNMAQLAPWVKSKAYRSGFVAGQKAKKEGDN